MKYPLVSIIVPVFNTRNFLYKCLESINQQTYKNIEVIIVDDGSTDNSYEIYNTFLTDSRFKVYRFENKGLTFARQFGIDNSKGEFFATIDSDDYVSLDFIEILIDQIQRTNSDICLCSKFIINDKVYLKESLNIKSESPMKITKLALKRNYTKILDIFHMSDSWNKMYRSSFVKQSRVKFILDKIYNGTDLLFNHLLVLHLPSISHVNKPLYYYRIRANSQVRRKNKNLLDGFNKIIDIILIEISNLNYSYFLKSQLYMLFISFSRLGLYDLMIDNKNYRFSTFQYDLKKTYLTSIKFSFREKIFVMQSLQQFVFALLFTLKINKILFLYMRIYSYLKGKNEFINKI